MRKPGFTLLETVIAASIILIALGSSLTANRVIQSGIVRNQEMAQVDSLANEGVAEVQLMANTLISAKSSPFTSTSLSTSDLNDINNPTKPFYVGALSTTADQVQMGTFYVDYNSDTANRTSDGFDSKYLCYNESPTTSSNSTADCSALGYYTPGYSPANGGPLQLRWYNFTNASASQYPLVGPENDIKVPVAITNSCPPSGGGTNCTLKLLSVNNINADLIAVHISPKISSFPACSRSNDAKYNNTISDIGNSTSNRSENGFIIDASSPDNNQAGQVTCLNAQTDAGNWSFYKRTIQITREKNIPCGSSDGGSVDSTTHEVKNASGIIKTYPYKADADKMDAFCTSLHNMTYQVKVTVANYNNPAFSTTRTFTLTDW